MNAHVTKVTDRDGRVREFSYDGLGRLSSEVWKNGSTVVNTISNSYDAASQLLHSEDGSAELTFEYDGLGRVTSLSNDGTPSVPTVVLTNSYDAASRRTGLAAAIGSTADFVNAYSYDNLGRLTRVTQQGQTGGNTVATKRVDLSYLANGQFGAITRYADLNATELVATSTYSFDQLHRLTSLEHSQGSTSLADYSWTYDANSRITAATTPDGTVSYTYDNNGQLIAADHSSQADETYSYDANGNRTLSGYSTGSNNRLTSDGTFNYQYDAEGNRTRKTEISSGNYVDYSWDHRNRLTAVTFKTSANVTTKRVEYTYDMLNRRISKSVDSNGDNSVDVSYHYVYDSAGKTDPATGVPLDDIVLVFVDSDGAGSGLSSLTSRLLHGPAIDQVFATEDSSNDVLWSLTDHQGTIRDWVSYDSGTDETTIVNHFRYDSFGHRIAIEDGNGTATSLASQLSSLDYSYTGREWDTDIQLAYYRARWYDPAVGRFISEDPIGFSGDYSNMNRYVGNSPTSQIDPSGMDKITGDIPLSEEISRARASMRQRPTVPMTPQLQYIISNINYAIYSSWINGLSINACHAYAQTYINSSQSTSQYIVYYGNVVNWWAPLAQPILGNPPFSPTDGGVFVYDKVNNASLYIHATPLGLGLPPLITVEQYNPGSYLWPQPANEPPAK